MYLLVCLATRKASSEDSTAEFYDGSESSYLSTKHPSGSCAQRLRLAFGDCLLWLSALGDCADRPSNNCSTPSAAGHSVAQYPTTRRPESQRGCGFAGCGHLPIF